MNREEITKFKIARLLDEHEKYDFDEFLFKLRRIQGLNRDVIAFDIGISTTKMFFFERGHFMKMPKHEDLEDLANYYGISSEILITKCKKFLDMRKNRGYGKRYTHKEELLTADNDTQCNREHATCVN